MKVLFYYNGGEHLGVECLISYLKGKGHIVDLVFDPGVGNNFFLNLPFLNRFVNDELIIKKIIHFNPDIVAFSCITNLYPVIKAIGKKIKKILDVPIIVGGIHPTALPREVIAEDWVNILCIGEGEEAFAELLERLEKKQIISDIKNLWVKTQDGQVHKNPPRPLIQDLDSLPYADKTLFHSYGALNSRIMIMTGRGCPFYCTFCVNSFRKSLYPNQKYLRRRSVDNVINELIILKRKYHPKAFRFEDDVFTHNLKWLKEFRRKYITNIGLPFHCYVTPSTASDPVLKELKHANCTSVSMGIQSGDSMIREQILKRNHSDKHIIQAARRIKAYKLKLISEFIFGFPTETPKEMWKSLSLNEKLEAYNTASFIFYPFPETELTKYCINNNYLSKENYDLIKSGYGSYHRTCLVEHQHIEDVYKFNSILPIYNRAPKPIKILLRKILKLKYGIIHKLIYILSIPLIDFEEFLIRVVNIPKSIIKTRMMLKK